MAAHRHTIDQLSERIAQLASGRGALSAYLEAVYVFGSSVQATDGWTGHDVFAARVALRDLGTPNRWRFFASGSWTPDQASATPILRTFGQRWHRNVFSVWRDGSGWELTSKRDGQWGPGAIVRWTAPTLGTAWTETVVANIPGDHYIHYEHLGPPTHLKRAAPPHLQHERRGRHLDRDHSMTPMTDTIDATAERGHGAYRATHHPHRYFARNGLRRLGRGVTGMRGLTS